MDSSKTNANGLVALQVTLASVVVGVVYFAYISLDDFPPDILRVVPVVWLIGAFIGFALGLQSVIANDRRFPGLLSVLVNVVNLPLAAVFMFAAAMGD